MKQASAALIVILALFVPTALAESFGVSMVGENEIPPGDPDGVGYADLILDGTTLHYSVLVYNIEPPTAIHIHPGARGETGPPEIPFTTAWVRHEGCPGTGDPVCTERFVNVGQVVVDESTAEDLRQDPSAFYLNVHNLPHGTGAVRGQLQFAEYFPVVGRTPGAAMTNWFTRFAVLNRSDEFASEWHMEFLPQSPAGNTARVTATQDSLAALSLHSSTEFPDPDFTGLGAVRILSDQRFAATAAVYNGTPAGRGDLGLALRSRPLEDATTSGVLIDLGMSSEQDLQALTGHRSNVGFFNPQFYPVEASFRVWGEDGVRLGERVLTIAPGAMEQYPVFDLVDSVAPIDRVRDSFWISWVASSPIFAYATVVNNETGDPEYRD